MTTKNRRRRVVAVSALLIQFAIGPNPSQANAASGSPVITVDTTTDDSDADPSDGICATAAGTCSLRAAIRTANERLGADFIEFSIPGPGPHRIAIQSALPTLIDRTGGVTIDGYSEPGSAANSAATGSNAVIQIEVAVPDDVRMLRINSPANEIRGLAVFGAEVHFLIDHEDADGNRINGNFIGTDAAGTFENFVANDASIDSGVGLLIELGADQNEIGAPTLAGRNVIAGNGGSGVRINHITTTDNRIQNNVIGLNPDLTDSLRQARGVDLQFSTSGNLIGGDQPLDGNLVSGHRNQTGIEFSHGARRNFAIGNLVGTLGDGNSVAPFTSNNFGIALKDGPEFNYVADNIVGGNTIGIWHKHNYTGQNTFVGNRVGVGRQGGAIPNSNANVSLTGHDQIWHGNVFANQTEQFQVSNFSKSDDFFYVDTYTHSNSIRQSQFHNAAAPATDPYIDITPIGPNINDVGDGDGGVQDLLNHPDITGRGSGKLFGTACAGCVVEVYVSGVVAPDGTIDTSGTDAGIGMGWIGTVTAAADGTFSLADPRIVRGRMVSALAVDDIGNTSELPVGTLVKQNHIGVNGAAGPSNGGIAAPPRPTLPERYDEPVAFACEYDGGTLTWTPGGDGTYAVSTLIGTVEHLIGAVDGTTVSAPAADEYIVRGNLGAEPIETRCDGDGVPDPDPDPEPDPNPEPGPGDLDPHGPGPTDPPLKLTRGADGAFAPARRLSITPAD